MKENCCSRASFGSVDPGGPCEFGLAGGSGGLSGPDESAWLRVWCANFGSLKEL